VAQVGLIAHNSKRLATGALILMQALALTGCANGTANANGDPGPAALSPGETCESIRANLTKMDRAGVPGYVERQSQGRRCPDGAKNHPDQEWLRGLGGRLGCVWSRSRGCSREIRRSRAPARRYSVARRPQRATAAARAISDRRSGVSFDARAFPPLAPLTLPRATRSGSFTGGSESGHRSRIASMASTVALARWFGSAGIFDCFMMS